jgi:hypothetical protein
MTPVNLPVPKKQMVFYAHGAEPLMAAPDDGIAIVWVSVGTL